MLREQIQTLQDKADLLSLEISEVEQSIKARKKELQLIKNAKKRLEVLEEQIGE